MQYSLHALADKLGIGAEEAAGYMEKAVNSLVNLAKKSVGKADEPQADADILAMLEKVQKAVQDWKAKKTKKRLRGRA